MSYYQNCKNKFMEEKTPTPMELLIEKIELYDQRGGINMPTLKAVLQSYLKLETEYLKVLNQNKDE